MLVAPAAITTTVSAQRSPAGAAVRSVPAPSAPMKIAAPAAPAKGINDPVMHAPVGGNQVTTPYHPIASSPTTSSPARSVNANGVNPYYYRGGAIANPVYTPVWGWNHGVVWMPQGAYWGGAFWGPFGPGAATSAEIMGTIISGNHTYPSYGVSAGSPGATLLSNYGLHQVRCGTAGLVVIHGPQFGVVCAYPNARLGAGNYGVNLTTLTLQSQ